MQLLAKKAVYTAILVFLKENTPKNISETHTHIYISRYAEYGMYIILTSSIVIDWIWIARNRFRKYILQCIIYHGKGRGWIRRGGGKTDIFIA